MPFWMSGNARAYELRTKHLIVAPLGSFSPKKTWPDGGRLSPVISPRTPRSDSLGSFAIALPT